jgi:hypothetical protein
VTSVPPTRASHIYQALLYLYPPAFRTEFGDEMAIDFHEGTGDAWRARGWPGVLSLWALIGADTARTAVLQWLRTGLPGLVVLSALWSTLLFELIAQQFLPLQRRLEPAPFMTAGESVIVVVLGVAAIPVLIVMMTSRLQTRRLKQDREADARSSAAH